MAGRDLATIQGSVIRIRFNANSLSRKDTAKLRRNRIDGKRRLWLKLCGSGLKKLIRRNHDSNHIAILFDGNTPKIQPRRKLTQVRVRANRRTAAYLC